MRGDSERTDQLIRQIVTSVQETSSERVKPAGLR